MTLGTLLNLTDGLIDIELRADGFRTTTLIEKGTAGEIYMSNLYDNREVIFITHDPDGVMQIIVKAE